MSYIILNGKIIAKIEAELPSGAPLRFSSQRVEERIAANRLWNLVNAGAGKVGNGAGWNAKWVSMDGAACFQAAELNPGEYFVQR